MALIIKIQMVFEFNLIYFSNCLIGILNISEAITKTCIACNVQIYIYLENNFYVGVLRCPRGLLVTTNACILHPKTPLPPCTH